MDAQEPGCYRSSKRGRDPLCTASEHYSLVSHVKSCTTWGKVTSRQMPSQAYLEETAAMLKTTVQVVIRLWHQGVL